MAENARDFFVRFIIFSIGPGISAILGFFSILIITWLVSPEDFGKASMFTLFQTIASLIILLGLDQAFVREYFVSKNKSSLLIHSVTIPLFFSVLVLVLCLFCYPKISFLLYKTESLYQIMITVLPLPFVVINRFNQLVVRMEERGKQYSLIIVIEQLIKMGLVFFVVFFHRNFVGIISSYSMAIILSTVISFLFVKEYWIFSFKGNLFLLRKLLRYGLPLVPATILGLTLNAMDKIALRIWTNFYEIGIYSVGFKIVSALIIFQMAFTTFWFPTALRWYECQESLEKFEKISSLLSFGLCFVGGLIIIFRNEIVLIFSSDYFTSATVVPFLIYYPILYTLSETTVLGIYFTRRTELGILVSLVAAGFNLFGNWFLVPKYGALGASIATAISYMAFFWVRTILSRMVWEKFEIRIHAINLSIIVSISLLAFYQDITLSNNRLFLGGFLLLLAVLCLFNWPNIRFAMQKIKQNRSVFNKGPFDITKLL